jgi:PHP family Zn ribbon phosphoesterase
MIAVTDHNSAENAGAVMRAAAGTGLAVIPGMEATSAEEIHVLGLFEDLGDALSLQDLVYDQLQPGENDEDLFGMQVVANEHDEVEAMNRRLLIGATSLGLQALVDAIHERNGLAIASHIDRESFSLIGQLGFIPPDLLLDGVEISARMSLAEARRRFPEYRDLPFVTASDAHDLDQLGAHPAALQVAAAEFSELRLALAGLEGRRISDEEPGA